MATWSDFWTNTSTSVIFASILRSCYDLIQKKKILVSHRPFLDRVRQRTNRRRKDNIGLARPGNANSVPQLTLFKRHAPTSTPKKSRPNRNHSTNEARRMESSEKTLRADHPELIDYDLLPSTKFFRTSSNTNCINASRKRTLKRPLEEAAAGSQSKNHNF